MKSDRKTVHFGSSPYLYFENRIISQKGFIIGSFISIKEASLIIGVSERTMRNWIKTNRIPAFKFGKKWKIPIKDFELWISKKRKSSL